MENRTIVRVKRCSSRQVGGRSRRQRTGVASKQSLGEPPRLFFDRRRRRFRSDRLPQGGGASHQVRLRGLLRQAFQSSFDLRCKLGHLGIFGRTDNHARSEEHTSELQSLMRISYAVFCLKKKKYTNST